MHSNLKASEEVMLVTKKHWLSVLIYPILSLIISSLLSFESPYFRIYFLYLFIGSIGYLIYKILERTCNTVIVTNLLGIEETGLFTRITMECPLHKINNVAHSQNILGRLFGFGNVEIQTAALHGVTIYYNVAHPTLLREMITTMQEEYSRTAWKLQIKELVEMISCQKNDHSNFLLSSHIEKLFELKEKGILSDMEYHSLKCKILAFDQNLQVRPL